MSSISLPKLNRPSFLLAYSWWDIFPVTFGILQFVALILLFIYFDRLPWPLLIMIGLLYSYAIAWNVESVSHNFIHNPFFKSPLLNRIFSLSQSLAIGTSVTYSKTVHMRHHIGNSDQPDVNGQTRDWFSIYRHGKNGKPESAWRYCFTGLIRGSSEEVYGIMSRGEKGPRDVRWAKFENWSILIMFAIMTYLNWHFMVYFLFFFYLGHVGSMAVGYYEHYHARPDLPIAWGVSNYGKFYNFVWFNNGYHAEHHFRPRAHWTLMPELNRQLRSFPDFDKIHTITVQHMFGFLDSHKDPLGQNK